MKNIVVELLEGRYATRSIASETLPENVIADLVEAIRLTPSCFNNQPWRFLFLTNKEDREKGAQFINPGNWQWANRAPLIVIGYTRKADDCVQPDGRAYHEFDLGMSVMNLMLAATAHKLVARPIAGFKPDIIKQLFGLEEDQFPMIVVMIGKPSDDIEHLPDYAKTKHLLPRERKDANEIVKML